MRAFNLQVNYCAGKILTYKYFVVTMIKVILSVLYNLTQRHSSFTIPIFGVGLA